MVPFCAIEAQNNTIRRSQKTRDASPSATEAPEAVPVSRTRGPWALADERGDGGHPDDDRDQSQGEGRVSPTDTPDERLRERRQHHGPPALRRPS